MLTHSEARSIAAREIHPASIQLYDTCRTRALFKYRAALAKAKEDYHNAIRSTWRAMGKPVTGPTCGAALARHWVAYVAAVNAAGHELDRAPEVALLAASLVWRL